MEPVAIHLSSTCTWIRNGAYHDTGVLMSFSTVKYFSNGVLRIESWSTHFTPVTDRIILKVRQFFLWKKSIQLATVYELLHLTNTYQIALFFYDYISVYTVMHRYHTHTAGTTLTYPSQQHTFRLHTLSIYWNNVLFNFHHALMRFCLAVIKHFHSLHL